MQDKNLLEVDRVVVNDLARIVRLPGTYNTAAKTYCTLPYIGTDYLEMYISMNFLTLKAT